MAVKFTNTKAEASHLRILCHGRSGAGKTEMIKTAPKPVILTSEQKLFALRNEDIPTIVIETVEDMEDALEFLSSDKKAKAFETVCIDSLSDIAEAQLADLKKQYNDPRRAYGDLADIIFEQLRKLRELKKKHVYAICKTTKLEDEGMIRLVPSMPGKQLKELAYHFDLVLYLEADDDEDDEASRWLITQPTHKIDAKGSSNLKKKEVPDLKKIIKKALK